jgi:phosphotransferase system enzyme I (PtsI)
MGTLLRGTPVVPGVAFAPACVVRAEIDPGAMEEFAARPVTTPEAALTAYDLAVDRVATRMEKRSAEAEGQASDVLAATAGLVRDKGLRGAVAKELGAGAGLLTALGNAIDSFVAIFTSMGGVMAERVVDLRDIERRLKARIIGAVEPGVPAPETPVVLVADDLAPADTAGLDPAFVLGLVTVHGGPTSHTAIIARQLGIPCVVAVAGAAAIIDGVPLLVDGARGEVEVAPDAARATDSVTRDAARRRALAAWSGPAATKDGFGVKILANVGDKETALAASAAQVEGVGLFRTELCFLNRAEEPSVEEQTQIYAAVLSAFPAGQPVVVRTLDAGSDKPISFASLAGEENPALGIRGLRLSATSPGLMERQLDAIAAAGASRGEPTWVMAPMVATVEEAAYFAGLARARGLKPGIMVEVPSAALLAHRMLEVVDFLSIGTNDLTQYTMAADRLSSGLAHLTDPWQPAVLHLVAIAAAAGREAGKPVGVCGEAAADPLLAPALVGMRITSLSMAAAAVPAVGLAISQVTFGQCEAAAEVALGAGDPTTARAAVREILGV